MKLKDLLPETYNHTRLNESSGSELEVANKDIRNTLNRLKPEKSFSNTGLSYDAMAYKSITEIDKVLKSMGYEQLGRDGDGFQHSNGDVEGYIAWWYGRNRKYPDVNVTVSQAHTKKAEDSKQTVIELSLFITEKQKGFFKRVTGWLKKRLKK